jgi:F0F1-type ATP synthase membrane subunit b/b'
MEIVPDPLLVGMFLPGFLVAVLASWFILWKPLMLWMEEREHAVVHARAEARRLDGEIELRLAEVDRRLRAARAEITELRTIARSKAAVDEATILAAARAEAEQRIAGATAEIAEQSETARRGLADASRSLADDLASQVLGRPVQA